MAIVIRIMSTANNVERVTATAVDIAAEIELSTTLDGLTCIEQHPSQYEAREGEVCTKLVVVTTTEVVTVRDATVTVVTTVVV